MGEEPGKGRAQVCSSHLKPSLASRCCPPHSLAPALPHSRPQAFTNALGLGQAPGQGSGCTELGKIGPLASAVWWGRTRCVSRSVFYSTLIERQCLAADVSNTGRTW